MKRFLPLFVLLGLFSSAAAEPPPALYVSPQGNDAWSGTLPDPAGTNGPVATLARARDLARALRQGTNFDAPLVITVRGGRYELPEPLVLTSADSGTRSSPTVFQAAPGETPVLSGGRRLTGWNTNSGAWVLPYPDAPACRVLTANGKWRERPRVPEGGEFTVAHLAGADPGAKYNTPARAFGFHPGNLNPDWTNLADVEIVLMHFWVDAHVHPAAISNSVVRLDRPIRRRLTEAHPREPLAPYYVVNVREALVPTTFYHDRTAQTLTYVPSTNESPDTTEIVAARLPALLRLEGHPARKEWVSYVEFRGLTFSDTTWTPAPDDAVDVQAAVSVPGAVIATGARHCAWETCRFVNLGTYALDLRDGCRFNRIVRNELSQLGAGGIALNGGDATSPASRRTGGNTITDNTLFNLGRLYHSAVGILSRHSDDNVIGWNVIRDLHYTAISVGWVWGYGPSVSASNQVVHNSLYNIGQQRLLSDMGGIYLLGAQPGGVVRGNIINNVSSRQYGGWGIYTDEGSAGVLIESNLVHRTQDGGFHQHYGRDNVVRHNIFAFSQRAQIVRSKAESHRSFTFEHNIVLWSNAPLLGGNWTGSNYTLASNLYWRTDTNLTAASPVFPGNLTLAQWQAAGHDPGSVMVDPLFAEPAKQNYALATNTPATALGITATRPRQVGPRPAKK